MTQPESEKEVRARAKRSIEENEANRLTPAQVEAQLREFLETSPLYRRLEIRLKEPIEAVIFPSVISMPCTHASCRTEQSTTWKLSESSGVGPGTFLRCTCVHCGGSVGAFWVMTYSTEMELKSSSHPPGGHLRPAVRTNRMRTFVIHKVGQTPAWNIQPPKAVRVHSTQTIWSSTRKELISMSQSSGIGAVQYLPPRCRERHRRLARPRRGAAKTDEDAKALKRLSKKLVSRKTPNRNYSLLAEMAPASLRPGNVNPLATLYANYSRGLHALSDEECLQVATELRRRSTTCSGISGISWGRQKHLGRTLQSAPRPKPWDNA